jgi:hypothetical protein
MSFFRRFVSIFVSPNRVFEDIRESKVSWWQPWIMVSVLVLVATWLLLPLQAVLLENNPDVGDPEKAAAMMKVALYVQMVVTPIVVLAASLIVTAISYVVVTLLSKAATFKKYFTLVMFADVVASVGYLASALILRARGFENVTGPADAKAGLSLRFLAPEAGPVVSGLLGSIEFFTVWAWALVILGLRRMFGLGLGAAIGCIVPLWLIYTVLVIVGEFMQGAR